MSLRVPAGYFRVLFTVLVLLTATSLHASIGLVIGEPFGSFGTMMPVGHAGIYLDHLCADTPTHLRFCQPGEHGVILSRYHDLRATNTDWFAVPTARFLYGVDDPSNAPTSMTAALEAHLRETYREDHLRDIVPDRIAPHGTSPVGTSHAPPYGDWAESIGAAFDRRLFLYTVDTTPRQDAAILLYLNEQPNIRRYALGRADCADFAEQILSLLIPTALHHKTIADFDMTTPKGLARRFDTYGHTHPELNLRVYEVPQIPGTLRRSRPIRGCTEGFIKTKRYLATLLIIQPEFILADWIVYEKRGKWTAGLDATRIAPGQFPESATRPGYEQTSSMPLSSAPSNHPSDPSPSAPAPPSASAPASSIRP